jgi:branched-chain amino acid transport system ATP-binding protein
MIMSNVLLRCQNVSARYGAFRALKGISVEFNEGEAVALFGHNGSGKSTLLRCCVGAHGDASGVITFAGQEVQSGAVHRNVRLGIGFVPQGRNVFKDLPVEKNLQIAGMASGDSDIDKIYGLFPVLRERKRQIAGTMSGGEQQMVAFGMALMTKPRVLLLDEPTTGLSPAASDVLLQTIAKVRKSMSIGVVIVEHNIPRTLKFVDRVVVMKMGRIIADTPATSLSGNQQLWQWF